VEQGKKVALFLLGLCYQKFGVAIEEQQEVLAAITDVMMNTFVLESCVVRTAKLGTKGKNAAGYTTLFAHQAMNEIERLATEAVAVCSDGDRRRTNLAVLRKLTRRDVADVISIRREVANRLVEHGKYLV
jgi:hypothetical protein